MENFPSRLAETVEATSESSKKVEKQVVVAEDGLLGLREDLVQPAERLLSETKGSIIWAQCSHVCVGARQSLISSETLCASAVC